MNKTELIAAVAEKAGLTKKDVEEARTRKARVGKNPQTKQAVEIPAATVPAFKAGKAFKDVVNAK